MENNASTKSWIHQLVDRLVDRLNDQWIEKQEIELRPEKDYIVVYGQKEFLHAYRVTAKSRQYVAQRYAINILVKEEWMNGYFMEEIVNHFTSRNRRNEIPNALLPSVGLFWRAQTDADRTNACHNIFHYLLEHAIDDKQIWSWWQTYVDHLTDNCMSDVHIISDITDL